MTDSGDTKDDVKVPDGEVGERLIRMFREEEKDCSKYHHNCYSYPHLESNMHFQTSPS